MNVLWSIFLWNSNQVFTARKIDPLIDIKENTEQYAINKQKVHTKYLGSTNHWLPVKPHLNFQYSYLDKTKNLGWRVNAKVSHDFSFKSKLYLVDSNIILWHLITSFWSEDVANLLIDSKYWNVSIYNEMFQNSEANRYQVTKWIINGTFVIKHKQCIGLEMTTCFFIIEKII